MKLSHEKIVQQAARAGRRTLQLGEEAGGRIRRLSKRSWLILAGIAVLTAVVSRNCIKNAMATTNATRTDLSILILLKISIAKLTIFNEKGRPHG